MTRCQDDEFSTPLYRAAKTHLQCEKTPFGPRFEDAAGDTETLVYHTNDGWFQTTLAYWREVLEHRARMQENPTIDHTTAAPSIH